MTTIQSQLAKPTTPMLNQAIRGNGLFSALSGLGMVLAAAPLANFLGLNSSTPLMVIGIGLFIYALDLFWLASREKIDHRLAWGVIALDVAWVVGSGLLLLSGWLPLTLGGKWAIAIVADIVAVFAIWQYLGLRKQSR